MMPVTVTLFTVAHLFPLVLKSVLNREVKHDHTQKRVSAYQRTLLVCRKCVYFFQRLPQKHPVECLTDPRRNRGLRIGVPVKKSGW